MNTRNLPSAEGEREGRMTGRTHAWGRHETGAAGKRVRTAWRLRQRYRLVQRLATLAGTALALALITITAVQPPGPAAALQRDFVVPSALLLACSAVLPWLVVGALLRRNRHKWLEDDPY